MICAPAFHTSRLVYRAVDSKKDGDFFRDVYRDPATYCSPMGSLKKSLMLWSNTQIVVFSGASTS
jgi:hypothetical protein